MFSPNAKTRPPSHENGLKPDLPRRNRGAREPARHPRIDRNPHGGVAPLHCPAGQTVVMTVEYRDGIGVTPLLTKGSHVEIRGVGTCPATWNESATLHASSGNPAQVSIAGGVLLSPLLTKFPNNHRRPSSLDPGLISQVTRSITGVCVQFPTENASRSKSREQCLGSTEKQVRVLPARPFPPTSKAQAEQPRLRFHIPDDPEHPRSQQPISNDP